MRDQHGAPRATQHGAPRATQHGAPRATQHLAGSLHQPRAPARPSGHAGLPDGGAGARARMGRPYSELLPLGARRLHRVRRVRHSGRLARRPLEPLQDDGGVLLRHRRRAFSHRLRHSPWQIAAGLTLTGMFAAIYHPVGIAMLVAAPKNLGMALGWNGLWGNLGLAFAAIVSGALMDLSAGAPPSSSPASPAIAAGVAFLALVPDPGPVRRSRRPSACTSTRAPWRRSSPSCSSPPSAAA